MGVEHVSYLIHVSLRPYGDAVTLCRKSVYPSQ